MASNKGYTNVEDTFLDPSQDWEMVNMDTPTPEQQISMFPKGATESTIKGGTQQGAEMMEIAPPEPRLGVRPQGTWDPKAMQTMFPEMFAQMPDAPWEQKGWNEMSPDDRLSQLDKAEASLGKIKDKFNITTSPGGGQEYQPMRPPEVDRNQFEAVAFQQIQKATGISNPFMYNPYDEVIKADKQLPELFNSYFKGYATWQDLPNLSKEQKAAWDDIKKQQHARVYEAAKAKKAQAMQMYTWMMQKFDYENKAEMANYAKQQREYANRLAQAGKAPPRMAMLNNSGYMTLHERDSKTGQWIDTGMRTGMAGLEDRLSPKARFAMQFIKQFTPKMDTGQAMMMMMMQQSNPELAKKMMETMMPNASPELQKRLQAAQDFLSKELVGLFEPAFMPAETGQTTEQSTPQAAQKPSPEDVKMDMNEIVMAARRRDPRTDQAMRMFAQKYKGNAAALNELMQKVKKARSQKKLSGAGGGY